MSTTEQIYLDTLKTEVTNTFNEELKKAQNILKNKITPYKTLFANRSEDTFIQLACAQKLPDKKYNAIYTTIHQQLSKENRLKLNCIYDAYDTFNVCLYPGDELKSATLYISHCLPKDAFLRSLVVNNAPIDDDLTLTLKNGERVPAKEWYYHKDLVKTVYFPVKTVTFNNNRDGEFSFYDEPLYIFNPYHGLSVEFEFSKQMYEHTSVLINVIRMKDSVTHMLK